MLFTCENVNVEIFTYGKKPNHLCACRGHIYTPHPIHIILLSFWRNKSNVISRAVFSFKRHAKQARYIYECVSFWLLREKFPGYKFHYMFFFSHVFVTCMFLSCVKMLRSREEKLIFRVVLTCHARKFWSTGEKKNQFTSHPKLTLWKCHHLKFLPTC